MDVIVPGTENTFERDRVDGADPRKKFGPNLSKNQNRTNWNRWSCIGELRHLSMPEV